jgi:transcription antitermination factor NusG
MVQEFPLRALVQEPKWFALVTRSRAEKKVAERISQQWNTFLPLYTQWRQWSDRKKKVQVPLIPSFVFVNTTERELSAILKDDGVVRVLRYLGKPAVVRDEEIEVLRLFTKNKNIIQTINPIDLSKGEMVEIVQGPFAGIKANYINHSGKHKIIVNIEAIGTFFQVEVAVNNIQKTSVSA